MEDAENTQCQVCGGTEYTKEGGHYYCTECHTQTQEKLEMHYDLKERYGEAQIKRERQVKPRSSNDSKIRKLTSWEYYNYILIGLTNELIELGAPTDLKLIVLQLWANYLQKHNAAFTSQKEELLPKLSYPINKNDLKIIYGIQKKKRVRSKSSTSKTSDSSISNVSMSVSMIERKRNRKVLGGNRRQLAKDDYEKSKSGTSGATESSQSDGTSLSDSTCSRPYKLNPYAQKLLKKKLGKYHLKRHQRDFNLEMKCHKLTSFGPHSPGRSARFMNITILYSILYLGLLFVHADIQLSDMIRFLWEGRLSFRMYLHFFPDEIMMEKNDIPKNARCFRISHFYLRHYAGYVAKYLKFTFIPTPDIEKLCERFITELNLPNELFEFVQHLIAISPPKMRFCPDIDSKIPNYEARALSYIMFALKFTLGLDDITENKISDFAEELTSTKISESNTSSLFDSPSLRFFNWRKWIEYIECRKRVLATFYFPIHYKVYGNTPLSGSDLFIKYWRKEQSKINYSEQNQQSVLKDEFKKFFTRLDNESESIGIKNSIELAHTLTPYSSYLNQIISLNDKEISLLIPTTLTQSFRHENIQYLLYPEVYATKLTSNNTSVYFNYGLANKISFIPPFQGVGVESSPYKQKVIVKISRKIPKTSISSPSSSKTKENKEKSGKMPQNEFDEITDKMLREKRNSVGQRKKKKSKKTFFVPHCEYWMYLGWVQSAMRQTDYKLIQKDFSRSFSWLMKELADTGEMAPRDLFCELMMVEIQFGYGLRPWTDQLTDKDCDRQFQVIKTYIQKKIKRMW